MAGGPSPSSTSPPDTSSPFIPGSLSSSASSPPSSTTMLSASSLVGGAGPFSNSYSRSSVSPINERKPLDKSGSSSSMLPFAKLEGSKSNPENESYPTIFIRKLPLSTNLEGLRSMLLFAKDLVDVDFVPSEHADDQRHACAVARFKTPLGAHEAKDRLNGKANTANDAAMVVEIVQHGYNSSNLGAFGGRRRTVDITAMGSTTGAISPPAGNGSRQSSRYNGTFQSLEKLSPPGAGEQFPQSDVKAIFSPRSPLGPTYPGQKDTYVSSKAMINDDAEDDTGKIIANPVEFAKNGESHQLPGAVGRRSTNPAIPVNAFAGLSLNTKQQPQQQQMNSFTSPRTMTAMPPPLQSPTSVMSPISSLSNVSSPPPPNQWGGPASGSANNMNPYTQQRHPNYPPVNPADQNPPCNTLYVGNLPLDTSEDELKAMFSKQRGYKRLCFRTKQNGPMCFVEFEDISFATKALNELYGQPLHNSVKGGIRLSFSKNPLGVRTGQTGANGGLPGGPPGGLGGAANIAAPPGFSSSSSNGGSNGNNNGGGPPPGLGAPPGLASPMSAGPGSGMPFGAWGNLPAAAGMGMGSGGGFNQGMRAQSVSGAGGMGGGGFPGMPGEYGYGMR